MTKNQHAMSKISSFAASTDLFHDVAPKIQRRIARREGYLGHLKQLNDFRMQAKFKRRYERAQALAKAEAQKKEVQRKLQRDSAG